jgi:pimeloyl-ACP methyl ester carboxylesterase
VRESLPPEGLAANHGTVVANLPNVAADNTVILELPAMTLNETAFPGLDLPTVCPRYSDLVELFDDRKARRVGLVPYVRGLEHWLSRNAMWLGAHHRIVIGHSFGAMLALCWLAGNPETPVDGLVTIAASAGPLFARVQVRVWRRFRLPAAPLLPLWNTRIVTRTCKRLLSGGKLAAGEVDFQSLEDRSDLAVDRAGWRHVDWERLRAMRLALSGFDVRESLQRIRARTIVLHGDCDRLFDVREASYLASTIPGAELRVISGAGHGLPLSHPDALVAAVHDLAELHPESQRGQELRGSRTMAQSLRDARDSSAATAQ